MSELKERIFKKLFDAAEIAKFTPEEVEDYEKSLKYYRDIKNVVDSSKKEGKREVAIAMKKGGYSNEQIHKLTGLTDDEINGL